MKINLSIFSTFFRRDDLIFAKTAKLRRVNSFGGISKLKQEQERKNLGFSHRRKTKVRKSVSWKEGTYFPTREHILPDLAKFCQLPFQEQKGESKNQDVVFKNVNGKEILEAATIEKLVSRLADAGLQGNEYFLCLKERWGRKNKLI